MSFDGGSEGLKDNRKREVSGPIDWLRNLRDDMDRVCPGYGTKILIQYFLTYFLFCKSLGYAMVMDSWFAMMVKVLGIDSSRLTELYTVVRAPWAMKPIWAIISDVFPICGYNKRFYILISVCMSTFASCYLGFLPIGSPEFGAALFFLFVAGTTMCDSMSQVRYTELMKAAGNASIVSYVWFLINACGLLGAYNLLLPDDNAGTVSPNQWKILIQLSVPLAAPMILPAALNWLAEEPLPDTSCKPNLNIIRKHPSFFVLSLITASISVGGVVLQLFTLPFEWNGIRASWFSLMYYGGASLMLMVLAQICLPDNISLPAIYIFMTRSFYLNTSLIMQYWYTANDTCFITFPPGPKFSLTYYQTVSNYGGAIAALAGVVIFDRTIQFWPVRAAFWVTTVVNCVTAIFELTILERWNQYMFGYSDVNGGFSPVVDQLFFIFGANAIEKLIDMLDSMPSTVLIGKLCPKGMEAQVFAILASLSNFGSNVGYINGSIMAEVFGVRMQQIPGNPVLYSCNNEPGWWGISQLGWLKIIGTALLPMCSIPFTWILLPNMNLNDDMLAETTADTELTTNLEGGPNAEEAPPAIMTAGSRTASGIKSEEQGLWVDAARASLLSGNQGAGGSRLF